MDEGPAAGVETGLRDHGRRHWPERENGACAWCIRAAAKYRKPKRNIRGKRFVDEGPEDRNTDDELWVSRSFWGSQAPHSAGLGVFVAGVREPLGRLSGKPYLWVSRSWPLFVGVPVFP